MCGRAGQPAGATMESIIPTRGGRGVTVGEPAQDAAAWPREEATHNTATKMRGCAATDGSRFHGAHKKTAKKKPAVSWLQWRSLPRTGVLRKLKWRSLPHAGVHGHRCYGHPCRRCRPSPRRRRRRQPGNGLAQAKNRGTCSPLEMAQPGAPAALREPCFDHEISGNPRVYRGQLTETPDRLGGRATRPSSARSRAP